MFFAERGAKVIKVENPRTKGDVTRGWKLATEDKYSPISAYYSAVNWNKEVKFLDLGASENRPELEALIREADIVITNFKFGDAAKFNLDFDTISKLNPKTILAELSGFGADDPRVAYDLVLQAESGFMFMNGTADSGPVKMPVALIDVLAAHQMKEGILEAILIRDAYDKAVHVEVSLYDAAIASLANQASNFLMNDHIPSRLGSKHPNIAPYGEQCLTADGQVITFAVGSEKQFSALCEILNIEKDERFQSNKDRVANRDELQNILSEKVKEWKADKILEILHKRFIPAARINDMSQVFESDKAQKLILEEEREGRFTRRVKTTVYKVKTN